MEWIAIVVVLASLGLALVFFQKVGGGGSLSVGRAFRRTPVTAVTAVTSPGVYRLSGLAAAVGQPPVSQASGRPYLARDLRIVESDGAGSGSTRSAQQSTDFLLDDGTGVALVRATNGVVAIDRDFEAPRTTLDQVPWVDELLRAGGYRNGSPTTCRIRLYEGVLEPGGRVGVVGFAEPADEAAAALGASIVVRPDANTAVMIRTEPQEPRLGG